MLLSSYMSSDLPEVNSYSSCKSTRGGRQTGSEGEEGDRSDFDSSPERDRKSNVFKRVGQHENTGTGPVLETDGEGLGEYFFIVESRGIHIGCVGPKL